MILKIEALAALKKKGTMLKAASYLRTTQSTVSKRIKAFEDELGRRLIERDGRCVKLTPFGVKVLDRTLPLLAEMREVLSEKKMEQKGEISLAISQSISISWGPRVLSKIKHSLPNLTLSLQVKHTPECIALVHSGEASVAIFPGLCSVPDLQGEVILEEPMVIVPSNLDPFKLRRGKRIELLSIDENSETWSAIRLRVKRLLRTHGYEFKAVDTLESFAGIAQMAAAGHGHGLVPLGVAKAFKIPMSNLVLFPNHALTRPVSLAARRSTFANDLVQRFFFEIKKAVHSIEK